MTNDKVIRFNQLREGKSSLADMYESITEGNLSVSKTKLYDWIQDNIPFLQDDINGPFGRGQVGILKELEKALDSGELDIEDDEQD